jgi:hypothetical protein
VGNKKWKHKQNLTTKKNGITIYCKTISISIIFYQAAFPPRENKPPLTSLPKVLGSSTTKGIGLQLFELYLNWKSSYSPPPEG